CSRSATSATRSPRCPPPTRATTTHSSSSTARRVTTCSGTPRRHCRTYSSSRVSCWFDSCANKHRDLFIVQFPFGLKDAGYLGFQMRCCSIGPGRTCATLWVVEQALDRTKREKQAKCNGKEPLPPSRWR